MQQHKNQQEKMMKKLLKAFWIVLGFLCMVLGTVGIVLPILPTVPFFLVTVFCFSQSSERLHNWFLGTKLYKNNLESYVKGEGMTKKTKIKILTTVSALMIFGFVMMLRKALYIPCAILAAVWVAHIIYFVFGVKNTTES